jgi:hypothetical protein
MAKAKALPVHAIMTDLLPAILAFDCPADIVRSIQGKFSVRKS